MLIAVDGILSVNQDSVTMVTVALFISTTPCSSSTLFVTWQALVIKNVGTLEVSLVPVGLFIQFVAKCSAPYLAYCAR